MRHHTSAPDSVRLPAGDGPSLADSDEPILWHGGNDRTCPADGMNREEAVELVDYLADQVGHGCEACGAFRWVARSGKLRSMTLPERWLTAEAAGRLPEADTSWMDDPWSRERFTAWMG